MKYDILLFDADDTLFDFRTTAERCFLSASALFSLPHEKKFYAIYEKINQNYWDMYSEGQISKDEIVPRRFSDYSEKIGVKFDEKAFAEVYETKLSETSVVFPETEETLAALKNLGARMFLITNGRKKVQRGRLQISGLGKYFENVFISDEMDCAKPSNEYFNAVSSAIPNFDKSRTLIIGDSFVSDISLGKNNGVDTCLVNKYPKKSLPIKPDYIVDNLIKLLKIVG